MIEITEKVKETITRLVEKGDPIVEIGSTQAGKSTFITEMAASIDVKNLLSLREARGKGSTVETNIIITDSKDLDQDTLYIKGKFAENNYSNRGDDNVFLVSVLYPAARAYSENGDVKGFRNSIFNNIQAEIMHATNDTLAYKLRDVPDELIDELINIIDFSKEDPILLEQLSELISETKAVYEKERQDSSRPKTERSIFRYLFNSRAGLNSTSADFKEYNEKVWACLIRIFDEEVEFVKQKIKDKSIIVDDTFLIGLTKEDYEENPDLCDLFLDSESGSKEFLFADISLLYRGDDDILVSTKEISSLTVLETGNQEVHNIRLVDTMGVMHSSGKIDKESERTVDVIKSNYSNSVLLFIDSHITATVKDAMEVIRNTLSKIKVKANVYVLFTHVDDYMLQKAYAFGPTNKRRFGTKKEEINWETVYQSVEKDQEFITDCIKGWLKNDESKGKQPYIAGVFKAAFIDEGLEHQRFLESKGVTYQNAIHNLVQEILNRSQNNGLKVKVEEGIPEKCHIIPQNSKEKISVASLYRNLVVDCKGQRGITRYYASSVRSVTDKWINYTIPHESNIKENLYGFQNIRTYFVRDMKTFAMNAIKGKDIVVIDAGNHIVSDTTPEEFKEKVLEYLNYNQNYGRKVAYLIGLDAYKNGFQKEKGFCYQYERLFDMLERTQYEFFKSENVTLSDPKYQPLVEIMNKALQECVKDYIDLKCIEVMYYDKKKRGPVAAN